MSEIHPLAYVDPRAEVGRDARIGPFCHVGADVKLGDGCVLHSHVTLLGPSEFGPHNVFFPQSVLGAAPQDIKYKGGPTRLVVGGHNIFREQVTAHRGTEVDQISGGVTRIGSHNLFLVGAHIAHDNDLGNHIVLANYVQIAGHCRIEDCAHVGGLAAMHHFVTIGRNAYVGGMTRVVNDVPPYMKFTGYDAGVRALNTEGLRRWKFPEESIAALKEAHRLLYGRRTEESPGRIAEGLREIEQNGLMRDEHVRYLVEFVRRQMADGVYGRARERQRNDVAADREKFYQPRDAGT